MANEKMRAFEFEGKRRGIQLDVGTWAAIDWLANQRGTKWPELAREWVLLKSRGPEKDDNLTRVIRTSAMMEVLNETIFAERADQYAGQGTPIWNMLGQCNDADFQYALDQANIQGNNDFGGFALSVGVSEFGNVTFYIQNNFRDGMNIIINTPFSLEEWVSR